MLKSTHRLLTSLLVFVFVASPLAAQQRRNAPPRKAAAAPAEPAPTFDSLLAAESYKVYCEVRGVGALVRSTAVNDLLDPVMKLSKPPREMKLAMRWLNAHAEVLASSRLLLAVWPSRPNLPNALIAIEFSSPEEAKKFYPQLRDFLPELLPTPTPSPSPTPPPKPVTKPATVTTDAADQKETPTGPVVVSQPSSFELRPVPEPQAAATPPYQMRQVGSLVLISDTQFKLQDLKPRDSKPLEEDPNFILARNRFAAESLFVYVDVKSIEKEEKDRQKKWQEEEQKRAESAAADPTPDRSRVGTFSTDADPATPDEELPPSGLEPSVSTEPVQSDGQGPPTATLTAQGPDESGAMFMSLYGALFGGESKWPEAVGVAVVVEGDAYILRTLIINGAENKSNPIPFVPQFVSGPAMAPESPNIFPADTDLLVSLSLDYPQVYEGMLKSIAHAEAMSRKYNPQPVKEGPEPDSGFAAFEKKLGFKIKDELLPILGNEIALGLSRKTTDAVKESVANAGRENTTPDNPPPPPATPNPVIAISIKDREAVARLIPKIAEAFGLKGANLFAQSEKRDGTELVSYAGLFAYAFVGDFLVVSPDAAETRRVVDAYLSRQTLASDSHFRNFTRWQPRQVLGQVYVGPDIMEAYNPFTLALTGSGSAKMNDFLSRLSPLIEPTTYALTNDGAGPLHELRLPRNLLLWTIGATFAGSESAELITNESTAKGFLRTLHNAEITFEATEGKGRYGTLEELVSANLIRRESFERAGYRIEVSVSGNKFEATAVPLQYGVNGKLSYFLDESGVLRGGDHGGGPATAADQPVH